MYLVGQKGVGWVGGVETHWKKEKVIRKQVRVVGKRER